MEEQTTRRRARLLRIRNVLASQPLLIRGVARACNLDLCDLVVCSFCLLLTKASELGVAVMATLQVTARRDWVWVY